MVDSLQLCAENRHRTHQTLMKQPAAQVGCGSGVTRPVDTGTPQHRMAITSPLSGFRVHCSIHRMSWHFLGARHLDSSHRMRPFLPCLLNTPFSFSGWLPNALLTTCMDGVARVWFETSLRVPRSNTTADASHLVCFLAFKLTNYFLFLPMFFFQNQLDLTQFNMIPPILLNHALLRYYLKLWLSLPTPEWSAEMKSQANLLFQLHEAKGDAKFFLAASINIADSNLPILPSKLGVKPSWYFFCSFNFKLFRRSYQMQWMNNKTIDVEYKFSKLLLRLVSLIASTPIGDPSRFNFLLRNRFRHRARCGEVSLTPRYVGPDATEVPQQVEQRARHPANAASLRWKFICLVKVPFSFL